MITIAVCGACGKMGANILNLLEADEEATAIWGVDPAGESAQVRTVKSFEEVTEKPDVIIDFSSPAALQSELEYAEANGVPLVIGSTGFSENQIDDINAAARKTAIFRTANFSLGVNLLKSLVKRAAEVLGEDFDIEIVEKHHNKKADAPSGTALMLAESANSAFGNKKQYVCGRSGNCGKRGNEIGMHSVRGGSIVGEHEVMFCGEDETITLSHSAGSKKIFAAGAIRAAKWIVGKPAGLYNMDDIFAE